MNSRMINLVLLVVLLEFGATSSVTSERSLARNVLDNALVQLMHHRRFFVEGFANGTAAIQNQFDYLDSFEDTGEARGRRKKMKQMNRTLMAIVMAYTLKFMFLIPTFMGTLVLLKFTTALAGFFYALFAAVLGLDHQQH